MRIGIVDMGSNAIRTRVVAVHGDRDVEVLANHREPVRLGAGVSATGAIDPGDLAAAVATLARFRQQCDRLRVDRIRAIATAATRDATNGAELVGAIRDRCGIEIEVISGEEEARLLLVAVRSTMSLGDGRSLLVDLGGRSVELVLVAAGEVEHAASYRHHEAADAAADLTGEGAIGRYAAIGGNIESVATILAREGRSDLHDRVETMALAAIEQLVERLTPLTEQRRIAEFDIPPDRADTIIPASRIYCRIGLAAGVERVHVPRAGIRDALIAEAIDG